MEGNEDDK